MSDPESTEIDEEVKVPQVPQAYDLDNPVRKREIKAKQKTLSVSDDDILSHYETKPRRERKAWTDQENAKLYQAVRMFGKDWKVVTEYIGTKTRPQVCSRVQAIKNDVAKNPTAPGFEIVPILEGIIKPGSSKDDD